MLYNIDNAIWEVIVRFEGDEDEAGKIPPRRVPARFVLRRSVVDMDDLDSEDDGMLNVA
jgi:hypothetical protein